MSLGLAHLVLTRWADRARYATLRSWLLSLYNRALLRFPELPLPARGSVCRVGLADRGEPLYVRLGSSDWYVLEEIFFRKEYAHVQARLKSADTIIDLGANIGLSVRFWRELFPTCQILAVEPDMANFELCRRNAFVRHASGPITFVRACAAASFRTVYLTRDGLQWAYRMQDAGRGTQVETVTMPYLLNQLSPNASIDLLKCDIEGAEAELFANCEAWISRIRTLVVEVHAPYNSEQLLTQLGAGFEVYYRLDGANREVIFIARRGGE